MTILITGGAGFVGSSLCIYLKKKHPKFEIVSFDNLKRRGSEFNLAELKQLDVRFVHGDIRNLEDLKSVGKFDILIEAAAEPSVLSGLNDSSYYVINNNLIGAINCFEIACRHNAKVIFLSTSRVYPFHIINNSNIIVTNKKFEFSVDQTITGVSSSGISEDFNVMGSKSFYGATKLAGEILLKEYNEYRGIKAVINRFGVIAGPRQMGKVDQGVATLWMARHFFKGELKYIGFGGKGMQVRDILHIDDVVELIDFQICNFDRFNSKTYNVGGGHSNSLSLREMTALCSEITGNKIKVGSETTSRPADLKIYVSNNSKLISEMNWKPKLNLEQIFRDIFIWIKSNERELKSYLSN